VGDPWNDEPGFFHLKRSMRAARALARLPQDKLAARAGLQRQAIVLLENTSTPLFSFVDMDKVRVALQKEGVLFMPETAEHGPAVAIKVADFCSGQMLALYGARVLAGLSQDELAKCSCISRQMVARIERGDQSVPIGALGKVRTALEGAGIAFLPETTRSGPHHIALKRKPRSGPGS
jgi:DNA-binding XRE family transcriptional regulator